MRSLTTNSPPTEEYAYALPPYLSCTPPPHPPFSPLPQHTDYAQSRICQHRRQPQRGQVYPHEPPHGRTHLHRHLQGTNHAPPHHGHHQQRRGTNRILRHTGRTQAQLQAAGGNAGLLAVGPAGCRRAALRNRRGGETRQERGLSAQGAANGCARAASH